MNTITSPQTLKYQIGLLITQHGLPEVLDRLEEWVNDSAQVNLDYHQDFGKLGELLEKATAQSLEIAGLLLASGKEEPWS